MADSIDCIKSPNFKIVDYSFLLFSTIQFIISLMPFDIYRHIVYFFLAYPSDVVIDLILFTLIGIYLLWCAMATRLSWGNSRKLLLLVFVANLIVHFIKITWAIRHYGPI